MTALFADYEVRESGVSGSICVEGVLYWYADEGSKRLIGHGWEVGKHFGDDVMPIGATQDTLRTYVHPPNVIERLLGISFERKLERARRKVERKCLKTVTRDRAILMSPVFMRGSVE